MSNEEIMEEIYNNLEEIFNQKIERPNPIDKITVPICDNIFNKGCVKKETKTKKKKYPTTLVIPDAHTYPGDNTERFKALNGLILDRKPDNIIFMGDWANLDSLSAWDLGKAGKMDGRRYFEDCKSAKNALKLTLKGTRTEEYHPRLVFLLGNHSNRIERYVENKPELEGHLSAIRDFGLDDFEFNSIVPYKKMIEIEGTLFAHAVLNNAAMPVSGKNALQVASTLVSKSIVMGHIHRAELLSVCRHGDEKVIQVYGCGAFFEDATPGDYCDGAPNPFIRLVSILTHTGDGSFDIEQIGLTRLKSEYL